MVQYPTFELYVRLLPDEEQRMNAQIVRILLAGTFVVALAIVPRQAAATSGPAPANPCATQPGSFKLSIDRPGIYEVTQAELQAAGWSGVPAIAQLHLYRGTCSAANEVALDRDSTSFRFYGEPSTSRYSATSVYWLRQEAGPGLSMGSRSVTPGSAPLQSTAV